MKDKNLIENTLSEKSIREYIENKSLQNLKIFTYDMTDSTNTRAKEYYNMRQGGLPAVFIANGQSAGRGRRGRSFDSERGAGIYISFLTDFSFDTELITVRTAVKCAEAIEDVTGLHVDIKWVNDIFSSGKKLAGILAEGEYDSTLGRSAYTIVGIGINLLNREFPQELSGIVTTLETETGNPPNRERLAARLIERFFEIGNERDILDKYRARSSVIGKEVIARRIGGEEFSCTVVGISDSGALSVRHTDGSTEDLISAEVSIKQI